MLARFIALMFSEKRKVQLLVKMYVAEKANTFEENCYVSYFYQVVFFF